MGGEQNTLTDLFFFPISYVFKGQLDLLQPWSQFLLSALELPAQKEKQHEPSTLHGVSQPVAQFTTIREMIQPLHTVIPESLKIHFLWQVFLVCASSPWLGKSAETEADFKLAANIISLVNYRYSHKAKYEECITCRSLSSIQ